MWTPNRNRSGRNRNEKGFTLLTTAIALICLIGMVGLAVDVGRMYIAKSESQIFTDSASLAATLELDGTSAGIDRAKNRALTNPNKWNFQTSSYSPITIGFAKTLGNPTVWEANPLNPVGYRYARVQATVNVPVYFVSLFMKGQTVTGSPSAYIAVSAPKYTAPVKADSSGGQEIKHSFKEGLFPFSPYAHDTTAPHFGLVPGQLYTLRWAANARLDKNTCAGDNSQAMIDLAGAGGGSERGYIEETSASIIRQAIVDDYQTAWRGVGDIVNMTGGAKNTERTAIIERVGQDSNSSAPSYTSYVAQHDGSGRRVVGVPINTGFPSYEVVQIGAFFLLRGTDYPQGGNEAWCAEYLGPWVQGAKQKGAADGSGAYVVRLVN